MAETIIGKKLKRSIHEKNTLRSKIERHLRDVSRWKDKLANLKSFKEQRKYINSIKRYISEIESLRSRLNRMNEDVDKHIRELGRFSDSEVKEFCLQLEQEVRDIEAGSESGQKNVSGNKDITEIRNAQAKLAELKGKGNLQSKIEKARKRGCENIEEIERVTGKIIKLNGQLGKVRGGATDGEPESTSGDREELLYTMELKRIARENAIYR